MGYFSNGTEGDVYHAKYCSRCVHGDNDDGCAVWNLHLVLNYDDCNNDESPLHALIPRNDDGSNGVCRMFCARAQPEPQSPRAVMDAHIATWGDGK